MFFPPGTLTGLMDITVTYVDTSIWSEIGTSINPARCFYTLCQYRTHWRSQSVHFNIVFREHVCLPFREKGDPLQHTRRSRMLIQWMTRWEWLANKLEDVYLKTCKRQITSQMIAGSTFPVRQTVCWLYPIENMQNDSKQTLLF